MNDFRFGALILAAGSSRRMGSPKLLLPWKGRTILYELIANWRQAGAGQVAPVVDPDNLDILQALEALKLTSWVVNPNPDRGMFSSIQEGAKWDGWLDNLDAIAIVLGDQPQLSASLISTLASEAARNRSRIVQPSLEGRPKHPVFLPLPVFSEISSALPTATLKDFLAARSANRLLVENNDPALTLDLDTPGDYEQALKMFAT